MNSVSKLKTYKWSEVLSSYILVGGNTKSNTVVITAMLLARFWKQTCNAPQCAAAISFPTSNSVLISLYFLQFQTPPSLPLSPLLRPVWQQLSWLKIKVLDTKCSQKKWGNGNSHEILNAVDTTTPEGIYDSLLEDDP